MHSPRTPSRDYCSARPVEDTLQMLSKSTYRIYLQYTGKWRALCGKRNVNTFVTNIQKC